MKQWKNIREYADWITHESPTWGMIPWLGNNVVNGSDKFMSVIWHRKGQFQTELYIVAPNYILASHSHPFIDDMVIRLGGQIIGASLGQWGSRLQDKSYDAVKGMSVNGKDDSLLDPNRLQRFYTKPGNTHGAIFGPGGGCFLTCQHWKDELKPCDFKHKEELGEKKNQEDLTWKDVAYNEDYELKHLNEIGERL